MICNKKFLFTVKRFAVARKMSIVCFSSCRHIDVETTSLLLILEKFFFGIEEDILNGAQNNLFALIKKERISPDLLYWPVT